MPQTTAAPSMIQRLSYHAIATAATLVVQTGRLLRLLPKGTGYFVGESISPRVDFWQELSPGYRNLHAVLGPVAVVVSAPVAG
ncbi:MAG: hypothetical protein HY794_13815 [Desulfarculus sp.]|nr:hypothetical protein [Desulfarculus sp.]